LQAVKHCSGLSIDGTILSDTCGVEALLDTSKITNAIVEHGGQLKAHNPARSCTLEERPPEKIAPKAEPDRVTIFLSVRHYHLTSTSRLSTRTIDTKTDTDG
jgi:phosphatidylserine decarboxylase